jgi:hypothetical protein
MVNEYFKIVDYGGTLEYYIFELANFSALAFPLLIIYKLGFINTNSFIVWLALFFSPLVFNYFLFSPGLFGDQFMYARELIAQKSTLDSNEITSSLWSSGQINSVSLSAKILGLIPLANFMTVTALAFTNKLILFLTFLWFKGLFKNENENEVLLFFLIPSLVLYSSMALRDTLVIVISIIFIINLIRGRALLPILLLFPLAILKIQMFAILSLYLVAHLIFQAHRGKYLFSLFIFILTIITVIYEEAILSTLNLYRVAFIAEDFVAFDGSRSYQAWNLYGAEDVEALRIQSMFEAIYLSVLKLPILLLMPMPWNWSNIFYPMQSIESCILIYLYLKLSFDNKMYENSEFILLTFILLIGLSVYALIMANEGTFVRYRFALYYPFLLGLLYLARKSSQDTQIFHQRTPSN